MLRTLRWTARIASLLIAIAFGYLWWRQPPIFHTLTTTALVQLGLLSAAVLGLLIGWWKERLGGAIALAGLLCFLALAAYASKRLPVVPPLFAMMLPALLYLIVARSRHHAGATP